MQVRIFFILLIRIGINFLKAEDTWWFKTLGSEQGLTRRPVTCIAGSVDAALWIGTADGLFVYENGKVYDAVFRLAPGTPVPSGMILCMAEDAYRNCLWIGTDGFGLYALDLCKRTVQHFVYSKLSEANIPAMVITALYIAEDKIWCGTRNSGIFNLHPESGTVKHFGSLRMDSVVLPVYSITTIQRFSKEYLVLGSAGNGIFYWDIQEETVQSQGLHGAFISTATEWNGGLVLGGRNNLYIPDAISKLKFTVVNLPQTACEIRSLLAGTEGLWVMTSACGIFKYAEGKWTQPGKPMYMPVPGGYGMYWQKEGYLWIGSEAGLSFTQTTGDSRVPERPDSLSVFDVYTLTLDREGTLYAGSSGKGLWYKEHNSVWKKIAGTEGLDLICLEDTPGGICMGTYGQGIWQVKGNRAYPWKDSPAYVYSLKYIPGENRLWAGTEYLGLQYFQFQDKQWKEIKESRGLSVATLNRVENCIWFAGFENGLCRYDTLTKTVLQTRPKGTHTWVQGIYPAEGRDWFACLYGEGLWMYASETNRWCMPNANLELMQSVVSSVAAIDSGWWINTHTGTWFLAKSGRLRKLVFHPSRPSPEMNAGAVVNLPDGSVRVGGADGVWNLPVYDPGLWTEEISTVVMRLYNAGKASILCNICAEAGILQEQDFPLYIQWTSRLSEQASGWKFRIRELHLRSMSLSMGENIHLPWLPEGDWTLELLSEDNRGGEVVPLRIRVRHNSFVFVYALLILGVIIILLMIILGVLKYRKKVRV